MGERLREPPAGPFEGEVFSELWGEAHPLSKQFDDYVGKGIAPEGAEPTTETLDELGGAPGRYVAFSHGGLIRIMAAVLLGLDPLNAGRLKVDNCHAIAFKWFEKPPHQLLAVNLRPRAGGERS